MVVDSHVHLWGDEVVRADWLAGASNDAIRRPFGAADYVDAVGGGDIVWRDVARSGVAGRDADGHGAGGRRALDLVDTAVVVTARQSIDENTRLLVECDGVSLIGGVIGWADLTRPFEAAEVDGLLGIRHSVISEPPGWLDRPDVGRGSAAFARTGKVLELLVADRDLPSVIRCADALPSTMIVVDHLGNPPDRSEERGQWAIWHTNVGALALRPNVRIKLSGGTHDRRTIDAALDAFGPGRTMFGSDWPVSVLRQGDGGVGSELGRWQELTAALSPSERHEVFSSTARTSYGLAT